MIDFKTKYAPKEDSLASKEDPFDLKVHFTRDQRPITINNNTGTYPVDTCYGSCARTCAESCNGTCTCVTCDLTACLATIFLC